MLRRSLGTCLSTSGCRFHDASVWSNVMGTVEKDTISARYAGTDGVVTDWPLTADAVRETLLNAMYDVAGRMLRTTQPHARTATAPARRPTRRSS